MKTTSLTLGLGGIALVAGTTRLLADAGLPTLPAPYEFGVYGLLGSLCVYAMRSGRRALETVSQEIGKKIDLQTAEIRAIGDSSLAMQRQAFARLDRKLDDQRPVRRRKRSSGDEPTDTAEGER